MAKAYYYKYNQKFDDVDFAVSKIYEVETVFDTTVPSRAWVCLKLCNASQLNQ